MKYFFSIVMLLFAIGCGSDSNSKPKSISNLSTFKDSTSYALGADLGSNLKQQAVEIDYDVFMAGLTDAMMDGDLVKLDQKQRREVMASLQKNIRDQAKKEIEEDQNTSLGIIYGSVFIALAIIISAAVS